MPVLVAYSAAHFVVKLGVEIRTGTRVVEERSAQGTAAARKAAEILASTLNVTATVYGTDANGEFVYGVYEVADGAANASSPLIKKLFTESAAASLTLYVHVADKNRYLLVRNDVGPHSHFDRTS